MLARQRLSILIILSLFCIGNLFSTETASDSTTKAESQDRILLDLYNKGWEKYYDQKLNEAIEYFNQAREIILSEPYEKDYSWLVDINESLGYNYIELGRYRQTLEMFYENLSLCDLLQDDLKWDCKTVAYADVAICYSRMGLQQIAVDYLLKASQIDIEQFPENTLYHFGNFRNLAHSYNLMGNYSEAEKYFEKTLELLFHPDIYHHYTHQVVLLQLIQLYLNLEEMTKAKMVYNEFIELKKDDPLNYEGLVFQTQIELLYFYKRNEHEKGLKTLQERLEQLKNIPQVDPHFYCNTYNYAADILIKIGKYEEARHYLQSCKELVKPINSILTQDIDDIESFMRARELYNLSLLKEAINSNIEKCEREVLLIEVYKNAEDLADLLEHHIASVFIPLTKNKIVENFMPIFETGINALYELSLISDPLKWTEKAILFSDRSRAILLIEQLMYKLSENQKIADILLKDNQIKHQYDSIFLKMIGLTTEKEIDSELQREFLTSLATLRLEREKLFRSELQNERSYIKELIGGSQVSKDLVGEMIKNNVSLLTHFFGKEYMYTMALSQGNYSFEKKKIESESLKIPMRFREEIERFPKLIGNHEAYQKHLKKLEQLNLKVFEYFIGDAASVFSEYLLFIAVDEASIIPLAGLKIPLASSKKGYYLIEKSKIFTTYSLKSLELQYQNHSRNSQGEFLAFAPHYSNEEISIAGMPYNFTLPSLSFNVQEVTWLNNNLNARIFLGEEATLENFELVIPKSAVLHLSGHAYAHDQHPELSFFAFSPQIGSEKSHSLLRLTDIEKMNIPANLVFLNGCQTGFGRILRGEGPESVNRAFTIAGASSLINTLWPINDHIGMEITKSFYKQLKGGKNIPSALRYSQLELIHSNHPIYSHPYFWSGYKSYGVPDNPFGHLEGRSYLLILIIAFLVTLIFFGWRREHAVAE